MAAAALAEHAEELARDLDVIVIPDWAGAIHADTELRGGAGELRLEGGDTQPVIWVSAPLDTAEPYLLALHEMGHHANPTLDAEGTQEPSRLQAEELAWAWAEGMSLIPITPHLRAFIERRLDSYRG